MSDFRRVTDDFTTAPQISVADVEEAARQGFKTIINNRPDGEAPDQPPSREIEAAARAAGLAYFHIPVSGGPTLQQVETTEQIVAQAAKPILAFCRSGTRSINTWSLAQQRAGNYTRDELVQAGEQAGYDLSSVLPR